MKMRWKHRNHIAVFGRYFAKEENLKTKLTILLYTLTISHIPVIPAEGICFQGRYAIESNLNSKEKVTSWIIGEWKEDDEWLGSMIGKGYVHCGWYGTYTFDSGTTPEVDGVIE